MLSRISNIVDFRVRQSGIDKGGIPLRVQPERTPEFTQKQFAKRSVSLYRKARQFERQQNSDRIASFVFHHNTVVLILLGGGVAVFTVIHDKPMFVLMAFPFIIGFLLLNLTVSIICRNLTENRRTELEGEVEQLQYDAIDTFGLEALKSDFWHTVLANTETPKALLPSGKKSEVA